MLSTYFPWLNHWKACGKLCFSSKGYHDWALGNKKIDVWAVGLLQRRLKKAHGRNVNFLIAQLRWNLFSSLHSSAASIKSLLVFCSCLSGELRLVQALPIYSFTFAVVENCEEIPRQPGLDYYYADPGRKVGTGAAVVCTTPDGRTLVTNRVCLSNGSWTDSDPFCQGRCTCTVFLLQCTVLCWQQLKSFWTSGVVSPGFLLKVISID